MSSFTKSTRTALGQTLAWLKQKQDAEKLRNKALRETIVSSDAVIAELEQSIIDIELDLSRE